MRRKGSSKGINVGIEQQTRQKILEHLSSDYTEAIRDPLWQNIYLTPALKKLISLGEFQKLAGIRQLGPAYLVYPGATHTRLNHSLGVFHLAKRIIRHISVDRRSPPVSLEGVKAFLCASLLHDLGHFPYTHSFKDLPLLDHEVLTGRLVMTPPFQRVLREDVGVEPYVVAAIVDEGMDHHNNGEILFFRRILSGVLDPDKLDYLNRDAFFCGVPYGIQDTDFFIDKIIPTASALALDERGLGSVESLLFAKYQMYRSVYWHRTVRIATAMIKKAVLLGLTENDLDQEALYGLDDAGFYRTLAIRERSYYQLARMVFERRLLKTAFECPFDPRLHKQATDLNARMDLENRIASILREEYDTGIEPWEVILDIPEPISFEVDLLIYRNDSFSPSLPADRFFQPPWLKDSPDLCARYGSFFPPASPALQPRIYRKS
ncbi:HD domain-containing protein [Marispirochaeta aestuarii]|uniref:HD domain-containing protein n=1 Tax=Marispirochaeta aestuarii TaxID=1963862 RepID=UPI0029C68328|nr:HD domain-containing protein [Marispirochaeta aestuarii]